MKANGPAVLDALREARVAVQSRNAPRLLTGGYVNEVSRSAIGVRGISDKAQLGDLVTIRCDSHLHPAEVVRLEQTRVLVKPFDDRIVPPLGTPVFPEGPFTHCPSARLEGEGDQCPWRIRSTARVSLSAGTDPKPVDCPAPYGHGLEDGLKEDCAPACNVVDVFVPMCFGQRMGVFAGSGVGKSTLLAMMTKATDFDTVVLALTGERGREVRDMLEAHHGRQAPQNDRRDCHG